MNSSKSKTREELLVERLERRVLKATMRRYREHRDVLANFDRKCHTEATLAMIDACKALHEATHGKQ